MAAQPHSESADDAERERHETAPAQQPQAPGVWLPFLLFVVGFVILVAESKYTLPVAADYALKGLGGGLCLVTVVWIRRQARKSGFAKRRLK